MNLRAGINAFLLVFMPALVPVLANAQPAPVVQLLTFTGDAVLESLTGIPGDPASGRAIVANRQLGLCLLCHAGPLPEERFQGNLAPDLAGSGSRWSEGQLRLRLVDASRLNPTSIMPAYYRVDGLIRINPALQGKTLLAAQQIEDVVAFLLTLKE